MNKHLKTALKAAGILLLVLIVAYSAIGMVVYSSVGLLPVKPLPPPLIHELVWPTVGFPALVAPGASLEAEVLLPEGDRAPASWTAVLTPVRESLRPLGYRVDAAKAWLARSSRWPAGTANARELWHVRFDLPAGTVPELYDLTVEWGASGSGPRQSDGQPHALSVTGMDPESFRFLTLADVHVHERGVSGFKAPRSDKGISADGTPVYFENAIEQVNLIRPDLAVILGDNVLAQSFAGEYRAEFERFYRALMRFEVPVFLVPGNHDCYVNEVDGAKVWERSLGPLYYSFDVGSTHFTALNTNDWPFADRRLMDKIGVVMYPRKWQGQVLGARNESDPGTYTGQLAWVRDDLASHTGSRLRVMLMHHDPYVIGGRGTAFKNEVFYGLYSLGGKGRGRVALRELASRYRVNLVMDGHLHEDNVARVPYSDGTGETVYANQTAVSFDEGGDSSSYPGYRLVEVNNGVVKGLTYLDDVSSIPLYRGSVPGGTTDTDGLDTPALQLAGTVDAAPSVTSYLAEPVLLRGIVVTVSRAAGEFPVVTGGRAYRVVPIPDGRSLEAVYIETRIPAAKGSAATTSGTPARADITISPLE